MKEMTFLQHLHNSTKRNYLERMTADKPACCEIAKQYEYDYWDGDRKYGYGGYKYDGRWRFVAEELFKHYELYNAKRILDIGCGKGHLLYEIGKLCPVSNIQGIDISSHAKKESKLKSNDHYIADCCDLPFNKEVFDFTYSINVFHNLRYKDLKAAIREMVSVSRGKSYICVESYRNEQEKFNLQCWALTCQSFYSTDDWCNILSDNGYHGDVEFITFR